MPVHPRRDKRAKRAANIHQRVVDRIADRAHIFVRRAGRGAHYAGLHHRHAERRQHQDECNQRHQWNGVAQRREPWRAERAEQEIRAREDKIRDGQRAAEAQAVSDGSAKDGQEPDQPAEEAGKIGGALGGEVQRFVEIAGQRRKGGVIGKALEQFADVGDPERPLKAGAHFRDSLPDVHATSVGKAA